MAERLSIPAPTVPMIIVTTEDRERGGSRTVTRITPEWYRFLKQLADAVNDLSGA